MRPTLPPDEVATIVAPLAAVDAALAARFPGEPDTPQPVHTCYLPADRVTATTTADWAEQARAALAAHAPTPADLAAATGTPPDLADAVHAHVAGVLAAPGTAVRDLRVDLEDGYGIRPDDVEDRDVVAAAAALREAAALGTLPASYGLRPKSLDPAARDRGIRTLDLFLTALGPPPPGLVVTLPKVSAPEQVHVAYALLTALEDRLGLPPTPVEIQVETPAAVQDLAAVVAAGRPRLTGLHVGTYDYSAALGISAAHQASDHPAVELATALMQLAAAGTGVRVSDGSSNLLPTGDRAQVHAAWRRHAGLVRRAFGRGLYQGWDLHPGQLVSRHAAVAECLLAGLPDALARLAAYENARADGEIADEPATARALAGHIRRARDEGLLPGAR